MLFLTIMEVDRRVLEDCRLEKPRSGPETRVVPLGGVSEAHEQEGNPGPS